MPNRSDERWANRNDDLRYCVFCKQYMGMKDWAIHPHNPDQPRSGPLSSLKRILGNKKKKRK